jgi:hypothetical protein
MTDEKLIKLEKDIESKISTPKADSKKGFVVNVVELKRLAKRINEYESKAHAAAQR